MRQSAIDTVRIAVALIACAMLLLGCSGLWVESDYDLETEFAKYDSYAWLPAPEDAEDARVASGLLQRRIERAVNDNLGERGMQLVDDDEADLLVSTHVSVAQKLEFSTRHYGYHYGTARYGSTMYAETEVEQYEEGTLVIDLIDAQSRELVWRGLARGRLRHSTTPEERERRVREAVDAILERYPP